MGLLSKVFKPLNSYLGLRTPNEGGRVGQLGQYGDNYNNWAKDFSGKYDFGAQAGGGRTFAQNAMARQGLYNTAADTQSMLGNQYRNRINNAAGMSYSDIAQSPEFRGRQMAIQDGVGSQFGSQGNYLSGARLGTQARATADNFGRVYDFNYNRRINEADKLYGTGSNALQQSTQYELAGIDAPETAYTSLLGNQYGIQNAGQMARLDAYTNRDLQQQALASRQADRKQASRAARTGLWAAGIKAAASWKGGGS